MTAVSTPRLFSLFVWVIPLQTTDLLY